MVAFSISNSLNCSMKKTFYYKLENAILKTSIATALFLIKQLNKNVNYRSSIFCDLILNTEIVYN